MFLDRMQKMFNIYKEEGEEMTENAKLRELFKCMKHTQLVESVKALEVCYDMDGLTHTQAANHLTAAVSKLPDYQMVRHVSNVKTGGGSGNKQGGVCRDRNSIYATESTIWTGHYDEWATMKDADKEKIMAEREHKKKARNGKGSKSKNYKQKVSDISSLTEDIQAMKTSVAELISMDFHFSAIYPIESKGYAGDALKQFIADFEVPDKIICDGSKEQTKQGMTFMEQVRKHHIDIHTTKPN